MKFVFKNLAILATLAIASFASAATPNDSSSFDTLYVTDAALSSTDWSDSVTISEGELLSFELHYYLEEGVSAQDMRFSLENLQGRTYEAGESETVTGKIMADNLSTAHGSVRVNFADNVRLDLYNVSWQKYPCSSVGCEENLVDSYAKVVTSGGMSIGNVSGDDSHYTGNVIVSFKVSEYNPVVNYNDCHLDGITVDHGDSYRFYSRETTNDSCGLYDLVRTCYDGDLSGSDSFQYATCSVVADDDADVDTNTAIDIDEDSARLRGYLEINDWDEAEVYFRWGSSSSNLNHQTSRLDKSSSGGFSYLLTGLSDDTRYYFQAVARGEDGEIVYGSVESFTTDEEDDDDDDDIDITTLSATDVDEDSAELRGEMEGDDDIEVWFAFEENDSTPSCNSSSQKIGETTVDDGDDFEERVTNLDEDEKYYYRACGEDADGNIISGSIRSFTTDEEDDDDDDDIDITTLSATDVDEDSAELRGEMEGDDDIEVWFAFEENDSTPSCNSSSQKIGETTVDDGDDFEERVTNLDEDEKYYYRACGEDADGNIISGSIRSFTTDEEDDDDYEEYVELRAVTNIASGISTSAARLNGYVFGEGDAYCYFQYGRTSSLGLTTSWQDVNLDYETSCSDYRTGLSSNTTYYYRTVLVQNGNYEYGSIQSFRTDRAYTPTTPTTPGNTYTNITISGGSTRDEDELEVTKWVSAETDPRFDTYTEAQPGETVYYKVRVENNTDEDLDDLEVIDRIPYYLELDTDRSSDDDEEKTVRWVIDLDEGESRTFVTEMRVREDAHRGDLIVSYASASNDDYSANSNDVEIEVESGEYMDEDEDRDAYQGASIFNSGFFPTTLMGWGILLIILLVILYIISRIIVSRNEHARVVAEMRQMRHRGGGAA